MALITSECCAVVLLSFVSIASIVEVGALGDDMSYLKDEVSIGSRKWVRYETWCSLYLYGPGRYGSLSLLWSNF